MIRRGLLPCLGVSLLCLSLGLGACTTQPTQILVTATLGSNISAPDHLSLKVHGETRTPDQLANLTRADFPLSFGLTPAEGDLQRDVPIELTLWDGENRNLASGSATTRFVENDKVLVSILLTSLDSDAGVPDARTDAVARDTAGVDAMLDVPGVDSVGSDVVTDPGLDADTSDSGTDVPPADTGMDVPPADTGTDARDATGCDDGETSCEGGCADLMNDRANCGACGYACGGAFPCFSGRCACDGVADCTRSETPCCCGALPGDTAGKCVDTPAACGMRSGFCI